MVNRAKQNTLAGLAKDSVIMMAWQCIRLVTSYGFLWLLYKQLSPAEIAPYSNFLTLTALAVPIFLLKPEALIGRAFFNKAEVEFDVYAGSVIGVILLGSAAAGIAILVLAERLETLTGVPWIPLLLLVPYLLGYGFLYVSSTIIQLDGRPQTFAALRGIEGAMRLGIGAVLVWLGLGWIGPLIALTLATAMTALLSELVMRRFTGRKIFLNLRYAKVYLSEGAPTVPMTLAVAVLQAADRFAVTAFLGLAAAGVYGVASIIAGGIWILANSFQQVWMPWLFSMLSNPSANALAKARTAIIAFSCLMCTIAACAAVSVTVASDGWIDPRYSEMVNFIWPLTLAYLALSLRLVFDNVFYFYREVWSLALILGFAALITCLLAWNFTSSYGFAGAAWSFAAGAFFSLFVSATLAFRIVGRALDKETL